MSCEKGFKNQSTILASCSSSSVSHAVQASGYLLRSATSAKFWYLKMARTRGAKSSSPLNRKKSLRKEPVPDSAPEPSPSKAIPSPVKSAPPKPPAKRYLTRSGGRPLQKRLRVESSEPIDLTSNLQSLHQFHHRFQLQFPRRFLCQFRHRRHLRRRKKNLRSLKRHFPSPKFRPKQLWKK